MARFEPATRLIPKATWFRAIGYEPHDKQRLYHDSDARFRTPICGRRFGKSLMSGRDKEPELMMPNKRGWIVGPTYDLGEKEFRVIWDDMIVGKRLGQDKRVKTSYNKQQGNMFIEFPWQTRLEVRTADKPENLVGDSLDFVIMSEAAKHKRETWERYIRPALADRRGSADFPTTPEGMNWCYDLYTWGQSRDPVYANYASWRFPSWFNEVVYPGGEEDLEIVELRNTLGEDEFLQEIAAEFTSFVGKIFKEWNEETHTLADIPFNPAWPNYIGFDFGYVNPMAGVEFQIDPWDNIYIWREHYQRGMIMDDHIAMMKERRQPKGYKIDLCTGDAADPKSAAELSMRFAPCLALPEAKEDWREGIDLVASFLKLRPVGDVRDEFGTPVDDQPKLFVSRDCPNTIREFNNYKSKPGTKANGPREVAQGIDDHCMDALRYALVTIYKLGVRTSLSETMPDWKFGIRVDSDEADLLIGQGELLTVGSANSLIGLGDGGTDTFYDLTRMDF